MCTKVENMKTCYVSFTHYHKLGDVIQPIFSSLPIQRPKVWNLLNEVKIKVAMELWFPHMRHGVYLLLHQALVLCHCTVLGLSSIFKASCIIPYIMTFSSFRISLCLFSETQIWSSYKDYSHLTMLVYVWLQSFFFHLK